MVTTFGEKHAGTNKKKVDAVFEGGGVKGIGLVGAFSVIEEAGYELQNIAGTSAGAIVAALTAAGYTAAQLQQVMNSLDYMRFKDPNMVGRIPLLGPAVNLLLTKGMYKGDYAEQLFRELLAQKNVHTFGDLVIEENKDAPRYRYKLQVIASDISRGRLLILPRDAAVYGIDPDRLDVARAMRMSMSIPYFFRPVMVPSTNGPSSYIVDGGILSNFPVFLFDDGSAAPSWPTFGFKLVDPEEEKPHAIYGPVTLFKALFSTMMEAHDARYIEAQDFVRTIPIPTMGVQATDFELSAQKRQELYESGRAAATDFLSRWNFEEYKQMYRKAAAQSRREEVWQK